jgi:serine/threonine protein kinase
LSSSEIRQVYQEIEISKIFSLGNSSGIVQVLEAYEDERQISIVMEYINGKTLNEWIREYKQ